MNLTDKVKELAETTPFTEDSIAADVVRRAKRGLPLNLQFFAEGGEGSGVGEGEGQGEGAGSGEGEGKGEGKDTYTRSEVDSEISKAVDKALKNRDAKHQEDLQKAIDEALAEKERLSKLSEKERKEEEMTKREKALAAKEAELAKKELLSDAKVDLTEKGLPATFAEWVLADDAEKTLENINSFKKAFDEAVNAKVKESLRQETPPAGGGGLNTKNPFSKEHFNLTEQGKLLKTNPELYKQLKAQANK